MEKKKTLLVITKTKKIAEMVIKPRFKHTFFLREIYNIKYITSIDGMRGCSKHDRVLYTPKFYEIKNIGEIKEIIRIKKIKAIN